VRASVSLHRSLLDAGTLITTIAYRQPDTPVSFTKQDRLGRRSELLVKAALVKVDTWRARGLVDSSAAVGQPQIHLCEGSQGLHA